MCLQACQYDANTDIYVVLGTTSSVVWTVTDQNNYLVTFGGGDPTFDEKLRFVNSVVESILLGLYIILHKNVYAFNINELLACCTKVDLCHIPSIKMIEA